MRPSSCRLPTAMHTQLCRVLDLPKMRQRAVREKANARISEYASPVEFERLSLFYYLCQPVADGINDAAGVSFDQNWILMKKHLIVAPAVNGGSRDELRWRPAS